jgi:predicted neuraminidase
MIHLWEAVAEPEEPFVSCHCSVIIELDNGDLLAGYYAGEGEARPNAAWVLARKTPGAESFDPLQVVADTPGKPEGNGILLQNAEKDVVLVYGTMHGELEGKPGPGVRWVTCDLRMKRSSDRGVTWSQAEMIDAEWGHVPRCKPIRLRTGEWMFGTEYKDGQSRILTSSDEGKSWSVISTIPGERNQHPALIERKDGSILGLLRPAGRQGFIMRSASVDRGKTWAPAVRTELFSPFAAIDAVRLQDERIALVWNDSQEARNPLTLALSEDEGETWVCRRDLVTGEGQFHYPAIIQSADGKIHVSFTNNRKTIDHIALDVNWIEGAGDDLRPWDDEGKRQ